MSNAGPQKNLVDSLREAAREQNQGGSTSHEEFLNVSALWAESLYREIDYLSGQLLMYKVRADLLDKDHDRVVEEREKLRDELADLKAQVRLDRKRGSRDE